MLFSEARDWFVASNIFMRERLFSLACTLLECLFTSWKILTSDAIPPGVDDLLRLGGIGEPFRGIEIGI